VKTVRRRRLVRVRHRVVFGTLEAVQQVLAACGWQINTAFVERLNLSLRQHVAAIGRRATTLCKGEDGLRQQLALYHTCGRYARCCSSACRLGRSRKRCQGLAKIMIVKRRGRGMHTSRQRELAEALTTRFEG
jgi:hypothetical protein